LTEFETEGSELPELHTWIAGIPEPCQGREGVHPVDPNTNEVLQQARESSMQQLERAVSAADEMHRTSGWSGVSQHEKQQMFAAFADGLDARAEDIARLDALDSGVPIWVTRLIASGNGGIVRDALNHAQHALNPKPLDADHADVRVHRVPWGPAALITPWNAPSPMVVKKLAFALAAGASAVVKPSSHAPHSAELIAEIARDAGFPEGTWSLVRGETDIGRALVSDARIAAISMTGSTATGRDIALTAAPRFARLQLELGSNNPAIVCEDADIEHTAAMLISGAWKLSGQWCEAPRRVYAHRSIHAELIAALGHASDGWQIGSSLNTETQLGPVAFPERRSALLRQREALLNAGATLVHERSVPEQGSFMPPSILDGNGAEPEGELFGPMLIVNEVRSDEEALTASSRGQVGLAGYVFTEDRERGRELAERLPVGEAKINGTSVLDMAPDSEQSFFANAGIGGHGDRKLLEFFLGSRVVGEDRPGLPL